MTNEVKNELKKKIPIGVYISFIIVLCLIIIVYFPLNIRSRTGTISNEQTLTDNNKKIKQTKFPVLSQ